MSFFFFLGGGGGGGGWALGFGVGESPCALNPKPWLYLWLLAFPHLRTLATNNPVSVSAKSDVEEDYLNLGWCFVEHPHVCRCRDRLQNPKP